MENNRDFIFVDGNVVWKQGANEEESLQVEYSNKLTEELQAPVQKDLTINLSIPKGFKRMDETNIKWNLCANQHSLKFMGIPIFPKEIGSSIPYINKQKYCIMVVGELQYNLTIDNLEPVDNIYGNGKTTFTQQGSLWIKDVLGYIDDFRALEEDILSEFTITIIQSNPKIVLEDGTEITYSSATEEEFQSAFDGKQTIRFQQAHRVILSATDLIS